MIKVSKLSKIYGTFPALVDVSFEMLKGEVVGFLGPNGAGKTTTMRIITGYTAPTFGNITVAGYDIQLNSVEARRNIGYLPENVPLYYDMTVTDYLSYMGKLRGMGKSKLHKRLNQVIEQVELGDYRNTLTGKLSKGYRQRTGLAQSIIHEPEVLIMDEPTIGIDPIQVVETRLLIKELGKTHTLLISSHILPEISNICERVLVIHEGRIVADGSPNTLSANIAHSARIRIGVTGALPKAIIRTLRTIPSVKEVNIEDMPSFMDNVTSSAIPISVVVDTILGMDAPGLIASTIINKGFGLTYLVPSTMTLEEIFLKITGGTLKK